MWRVHNTNIDTASPSCSTAKNTTCSLKCSPDLNSIKTELSLTQFLIFFLIYLIFASASQVCSTIDDIVCFQQIGDQPDKYGRQRIFGSIGWGFTCLISGFLVDMFSKDDSRHKNYGVVFASSAAIFILDAIWCYTYLKVKLNKKLTFKYKEVRNLFYKAEVLVFTCWIIFFGSTEQVAWNYTFWYFEEISTKEQMKWLKSWQGVSGFVCSIFGDAVIFFFSGKIIRKVRTVNSMSLLLLVQCIRYYIATTIVDNQPLIIILLSWLDGILFGTAYAIMTFYANQIAFPGTEATVQAMFNSLYLGIGSSTGTLYGGILYSYIGGAQLFQCMSIIILCSMTLHVFNQWLIHRPKSYSLNED